MNTQQRKPFNYLPKTDMTMDTLSSLLQHGVEITNNPDLAGRFGPAIVFGTGNRYRVRYQHRPQPIGGCPVGVRWVVWDREALDPETATPQVIRTATTLQAAVDGLTAPVAPAG